MDCIKAPTGIPSTHVSTSTTITAYSTSDSTSEITADSSSAPKPIPKSPSRPPRQKTASKTPSKSPKAPIIEDVSSGVEYGNPPQNVQTAPTASASAPQLNSERSVDSSTSQAGPAIIASSVVGIFLLVIAIVIFIRGRSKRNSSSEDTTDTVFEVIRRHIPDYIDEIQLNLGDVVTVQEQFDDGWAFGSNITTGGQGSFPLRCLSGFYAPENISIETGDMKPSRHSSLNYGSSKSPLSTSPITSF